MKVYLKATATSVPDATARLEFDVELSHLYHAATPTRGARYTFEMNTALVGVTADLPWWADFDYLEQSIANAISGAFHTASASLPAMTVAELAQVGCTEPTATATATAADPEDVSVRFSCE